MVEGSSLRLRTEELLQEMLLSRDTRSAGLLEGFTQMKYWGKHGETRCQWMEKRQIPEGDGAKARKYDGAVSVPRSYTSSAMRPLSLCSKALRLAIIGVIFEGRFCLQNECRILRGTLEYKLLTFTT